MTYDPHRTTVLPTTQSDFPITEDLPVVRVRRRRPWVRNLGLVLLVVGLAVAFAFAANVIRDSRSTTTDTVAAPTARAVTPTAPPTASAVVTTTEPGYWQVVGVADGLNVRTGPGTSNAVIGVLVAGQRHVFATGERASSGGEWIQISLDDDDQVGWVSARFLAPDEPPSPGEPPATISPPTAAANTSTVCFASPSEPIREARINFTNRIEISGLIATQLDDGELRQNVTGTLDDGEAIVTLTDSAADTIIRQKWIFNPANVLVGDGSSLRVVDCASVSLS